MLAVGEEASAAYIRPPSTWTVSASSLITKMYKVLSMLQLWSIKTLHI
jgi:hypothetical protein